MQRLLVMVLFGVTLSAFAMEPPEKKRKIEQAKERDQLINDKLHVIKRTFLNECASEIDTNMQEGLKKIQDLCNVLDRMPAPDRELLLDCMKQAFDDYVKYPKEKVDFMRIVQEVVADYVADSFKNEIEEESASKRKLARILYSSYKERGDVLYSASRTLLSEKEVEDHRLLYKINQLNKETEDNKEEVEASKK